MPQPASVPIDLQASVIELGSGSYILLSFFRDASAESAVLTDAERQVALAILAGRSNAEIARIRGTSPRTIANQVAHIFRKLGVKSRSEFVALRQCPL
jgi:DNA-binding CsgD family transcriptional regulator